MQSLLARLACLLALILLLLVPKASAQINVTEVTVDSGDYILGAGSVDYSFTIEGAKPGTTPAEALVAPYYYIIYAQGVDVYGNPFFQQLEQGTTNTLYGPVTPATGSATAATNQTFSGSWSTGDVTLLNYFPLRPGNNKRAGSYSIVLRLYGDGVTPATAPVDDAAFRAPSISRSAGQIYWYTNDGPDLQMQGVTYNSGTYEGGNIIRMTTTWNNLIFPLLPGEFYKVHNMLTDNASIDWRPPTDPNNPSDAVVPDNDDFLLSEYTMSGDRPVESSVNPTPIIPDGSSKVRQIDVSGTPAGLIPTYGIRNTTVVGPTPTFYESTLRLYQPQPDDGVLDVGESVSVTVEVKIPQNYAGTYFVAARVDPENTVPEPPDLRYLGSNLRLEITDGQPDNNTFVSNASAKITIDGPSPAPTVEAVSSISYQDGEYVQGGGETSNQSSVSSDGNVIAFASAARNLLVPPATAELFINSEGRGTDMVSQPGVPANDPVGQYFTANQQIFLRLRQTRENYLVSGVAGEWANTDCFNPNMSSDGGEFIAFDSRASNLGVTNSGNRSLIYVANPANQTMVVVSRNSSGDLANGDSFNPSMSATGRFVAFESVATNLDPSRPIPAGNSAQQIYLHDRDVDADGIFDEPGNIATYLVSVSDLTDEPSQGQTLSPAVSLDDSGSLMYVGYVSFENMGDNGASGSEQVYRATVQVSGGTPGFVASSVRLVSANNAGDAARKVPGAPNNSIEPAVNIDGTQIAFSSSADNLVLNPLDGTYVPTFPDPNDPLVRPGGDYNKVPDVFVRDFVNNTTVRVSESIPRVATGTISFVSPTPGLPSSNNLPQNNPANGDKLEIYYPAAPNGPPVLQQTFVFSDAPAPVSDVEIGPDVPIAAPAPVVVVTGQDVRTTRDNLVDAINSSGLDLVASATTPPNTEPNMGYSPSIYLRSLIPGEDGNGAIKFVPVAPPAPGEGPVVVDTDLTGGGTQADDAVAAVQGVPAGSNQPTISGDGRIVAFRSIAGNLEAQRLTPENDIDGGPPYDEAYPPSPRQGELLRPDLFPASNVYLHNRQVDPSIVGFDQPENVSTTKVSFNNFGYPTTVSAQQATGLGAFTTAANQAPSISGNGRFISFSSGSEVYGGLVFGRNNLEPLDFQNARDVYLYDQQTIGIAPPPTESRPEITITSPANGLSVPPRTTLAISAEAIPKLGKTIASVQFYINGAPAGAPLTSEPYAFTQSFNNPGRYVVRAVATDSRGITSAASVTFNVAPPTGEPPTVFLTTPVSGNSYVVIGSDMVFNAVASDPDGIVPGSVKFFVSGSPLPGVVEGFDNNYSVRFKPNRTGTFTLFAQATDADGNTTISDIKTINVYSAASAFPTVEIFDLQAGTPTIAGGVIQLRARATFFATSPVNSSVWFYADGVFLGQGELQPDGTYLLNWNVPTTPRAYARVTATLVAVNGDIFVPGPDDGATVTPVFVYVPSLNFITINTIVGALPTVALTSPSTGTTVPVGTGVLVQATASVPGGQGVIERVEFYQNGNLITPADTSAPYSVNFVPPSAGQYSIVAVAYSTAGLVASSTSVIVNGVQGTPPTASLTVSGGTSDNSMPVPEPVISSTVVGGTKIVFTYLAMNGVTYNLWETSALTAPWVASTLVPIVSPDQSGVPANFKRMQFEIGLPSPPRFFKLDYPTNSGGFRVNENAVLAAQANDVDGTIARVEFLVNGVVVSTVAGSPYRFDYLLTAPGRYEIVARATDNLGNVTDSTPVVVFVTNGSAPTVSITTPIAGTEVVPGIPVSVTANASDADGSVSQVQLVVNSVVVGTDTQAPYVFTDGGQFSSGANTTFTPPSEGTYVLVARATDNLGNVTESASVTVTAKSPNPVGLAPLVQITQPLGQLFFVTGSSFFINAQATDGDGVILPGSVNFTVDGLPIPGATVGQIGEYYGVRYTPTVPFSISTIRASATDDAGNTTLSQPSFTVLNLPLRPLPSVNMLSLLPGAPRDAGGTIRLRAEVFFGNTTATNGDDRRVEFYANNVFVGVGAPDPADPEVYFYDWETPAAASAYVVQARVVELNFESNVGDNNVIRYFGSIISPNSTAVNTIPGVLPRVAITNPVNNQQVNVNQALTVDATAYVPVVTTITAAPAVNGATVTTIPTVGSQVVVGSTLFTTTAGPINSTVAGQVEEVLVNVGATLATGQPLVRISSNTDASGIIARVEFFANGVLIATDNAFPYSVSTVPPSTGLYTLNAIAYSQSGLVRTSEPVTISAVNGAPPTITSFTVPASGILGSTAPVRLVVNDPDSTVAQVEFLVNGVVASTLTAWPYNYDMPLTNAGVYTVQARVTDNIGNVVLSPIRQLVATQPNPPSITITNPANGASFLPGSLVTVQATASGGGGSITRVEFFANAIVLATQTVAPFQTAFTPTAAGEYLIRAVVTNSLNDQVEATVTITVGPPAPGTTGAFVYDMYDKLLNAVPTAAEYDYYVQQLDLNLVDPNDGLTRPEFVAQLIYSQRYLDVQNRVLDFYYRLGVAPATVTYDQQILLIQTALPPVLLPLTVYPPFTSNPTPPFGATTTQATVAQQIINSGSFSTAFPGVAAYDSNQFLGWFYPRLGGQYGDPFPVLNMMDTYTPSAEGKGAGVSFLTAMYQNLGNFNPGASAAQRSYQYQLRATSVNWLLGSSWQTPTTPAVTTYDGLLNYLGTILPPP